MRPLDIPVDQKPRGPGRPPKFDGQAQTKRLQLKMTPRAMEVLDEMRGEMCRTEFFMELLRKEYRDWKKLGH